MSKKKDFKKPLATNLEELQCGLPETLKTRTLRLLRNSLRVIYSDQSDAAIIGAIKRLGWADRLALVAAAEPSARVEASKFAKVLGLTTDSLSLRAWERVGSFIRGWDCAVEWTKTTGRPK